MRKTITLKSKFKFNTIEASYKKLVEFKKNDMLSKLCVDAYKYGNILMITEWEGENENGLEYILTIDVYENKTIKKDS